MRCSPLIRFLAKFLGRIALLPLIAGTQLRADPLRRQAPGDDHGTVDRTATRGLQRITTQPPWLGFERHCGFERVQSRDGQLHESSGGWVVIRCSHSPGAVNSPMIVPWRLGGEAGSARS